MKETIYCYSQKAYQLLPKFKCKKHDSKVISITQHPTFAGPTYEEAIMSCGCIEWRLVKIVNGKEIIKFPSSKSYQEVEEV